MNTRIFGCALIFVVFCFAGHVQSKTRILRIQAVVLSDNDRSRMAKISPGELALWLQTANRTLKASGAHFQLAFDAKQDWKVLRSSALNGLHNYKPECLPLFAQGRKVAAQNPNKLTVFFRYGRKEKPTGNGFGVRPKGQDPGFIVMPGFESTTIKRGPNVPRLQNRKLFVHELGHFMGLKHTFPGSGYKQPADLNALRIKIKTQTDFDGDGISDTPADPYVHLWFRFFKENQCHSSRLNMLKGINVLRQNPMAYLNCPPYRFTKKQIESMHKRLSHSDYAYLLN